MATVEVREALTRFRRLLATSAVPRAPTNRTANLTAAEVRCVHVRVGQTVAQGFQGGVEITCGNALGRGARDICCGDRPGDISRSGRWAGWLATTATQEYHYTTSDLTGREMEMCHGERR